MFHIVTICIVETSILERHMAIPGAWDIFSLKEMQLFMLKLYSKIYGYIKLVSKCHGNEIYVE